MIDLTRQVESTYEIKMHTGDILHINKPKQKLLKRLTAMETLTDSDMAIDEIYNILLTILNNNREGKKYTLSDIEDVITLDIALIILKDYIEDTVAKLKK